MQFHNAKSACSPAIFVKKNFEKIYFRIVNIRKKPAEAGRFMVAVMQPASQAGILYYP